MQLTMSDIAEVCWTHCWQVTILIAVVLFLGATLFRQRPHIQYVLWALVFVKSLTLPIWGSPTSVFSWVQPRELADDAGFAFVTPAPSPNASAPPVNAEVAQTTIMPEQAIDLAPILLTVWGIGTVVLLSLAVRRWVGTSGTD